MAIERIQRQRIKGWRMPSNARYVGRPTRYANPFDWQLRMKTHGETRQQAKEWAVASFRAVWIEHADGAYREYLDAIRGQNLACWCAPSSPCHADVLLELANPPQEK